MCVVARGVGGGGEEKQELSGDTVRYPVPDTEGYLENAQIQPKSETGDSLLWSLGSYGLEGVGTFW